MKKMRLNTSKLLIMDKHATGHLPTLKVPGLTCLMRMEDPHGAASVTAYTTMWADAQTPPKLKKLGEISQKDQEVVEALEAGRSIYDNYSTRPTQSS